MTNKITKVYKNGVEYDIYANGGAAGAGDVSGPASATNGHLAVFDGTTGKLIKDGGAVPTSFNPGSGSTGQVLTKTADGYGYANAPVTSVNGSTGAVTVTVPTKVSDLSNDAGYTTNTGTITSVKMNGSVVSSSGQADLGTVITSHQSIKTINNQTITGTGNVSVGTLTAETVASGDSGTNYTIKVSSSAPASGTAATTITFVTA